MPTVCRSPGEALVNRHCAHNVGQQPLDSRRTGSGDSTPVIPTSRSRALPASTDLPGLGVARRISDTAPNNKRRWPATRRRPFGSETAEHSDRRLSLVAPLNPGLYKIYGRHPDDSLEGTVAPGACGREHRFVALRGNLWRRRSQADDRPLCLRVDHASRRRPVAFRSP